MALMLANAFSLNMLGADSEGLPDWDISAREITLSRAQRLASDGIESTVGHADTARLFANLLGVEVPMKRTTIVIDPNKGGTMLVGQYSGARLPEGAATLPEGAVVRWFFVKVEAAS